MDVQADRKAEVGSWRLCGGFVATVSDLRRSGR